MNVDYCSIVLWNFTDSTTGLPAYCDTGYCDNAVSSKMIYTTLWNYLILWQPVIVTLLGGPNNVTISGKHCIIKGLLSLSPARTNEPWARRAAWGRWRRRGRVRRRGARTSAARGSWRGPQTATPPRTRAIPGRTAGGGKLAVSRVSW